MEQYKDPIIKEMEKRAKEVGGHGGMDFIMDSRLIYCFIMAYLWIWMSMTSQSGAHSSR